ncbi:MAG: carboxypeptidase regulatory-like domain-containing protein [Candidatus Saccharicenans sp.]
MRKIWLPLLIILLSVSMAAQVRTGNIYGKVVDAEGNPLPGVTVTLSSSMYPAQTTVTGPEGQFRFLSLPPAKDYTIKCELQGFKTKIESGIIVVIGGNTNLSITMEQGVLEEQVTVTAVTPMVDTKKTTVGKNVTQEVLQSLPTARDPWNVMALAPSVIMDRENVGGSESGQQASYYARGDVSGGANNVWALDGVVVTDPAAIGASPIYWDFDSFEEMNVVVGGADVTVQTGGVGLNMVTRRGGNKVSLTGRFYLTDNYFQAKYTGKAYNKINQIKDYGFSLGGPLIRDKAWLWMSYGVQDINALTIIGTPQKPTLEDYNFKLNLQPLKNNRFEALFTAGQKKFIGRSSSQSFPEGYDQGCPFHWGSPIIKIQDEQMFGTNLLLSFKFAYMNAAFSLIPHSDPDMNDLVMYDATKDVTYDNWYYITKRPMYDYTLNGQYFNDNFLNLSHEIKFGVEYITRRVTTDSAAPGNLYMRFNLNYPDIDWEGTGNPGFTPGMRQMSVYSAYNLDWSVDQYTAYIQDTITKGRLTVLLGLRFDRQQPKINSSWYYTINDNPVWDKYAEPDVKAALKAFMPGMIVPNIKPDYRWDVLSPRIGITYDIFGTGKTIFKLSGAKYGDFMGTGSSNYLFNPYGAAGCWLDFWWLDANEDMKMQADELYWNDPDTYAPIPLIVGGAINPDKYADLEGYSWGGFTPGSQTAGPSPYFVNKKATSSYTYELLATLEHELRKNLSVGLNFIYRKYSHFSWDVPYYTNGPYGDYRINGQDVIRDYNVYDVAGQIPTSLSGVPGADGVDLGEGAGKSYYLMRPGYGYTPYTYHTLNNNYATYWGIDLLFNKRLSDKWMLNGSVSYMDQRYHYRNGVGNPTNLWAIDNQLYAPYIGGASGKISQYVFSHWMVKLEGLYQLPYGFDISFTFNARQGYVIPHYMTVVDYRWPNSYNRSTSVYLDIFGKDTLPVFYQLNLRLEKEIRLGDTGRIYLMADGFNVFNKAIINRRYPKNEGTLYIYSDGSMRFSKYANYYKINEYLNPFIMRLGVRFTF